MAAVRTETNTSPTAAGIRLESGLPVLIALVQQCSRRRLAHLQFNEDHKPSLQVTNTQILIVRGHRNGQFLGVDTGEK